MNSYIYNGTTYFQSKFSINNYDCYYEYYKDNNNYIIYIYNYEDDNMNTNLLKVISPDLKLAKKILKEKIKEYIKNQQINNLIHNGYKIYLNLSDVLKDYSNFIGYHITEIKNKNSIIQQGLIPNYIPDEMVCNASDIIDKYKPSNTPADFSRKSCIYLHPRVENDLFSQYEPCYTSCALFAVNFRDYIKDAIISSEGISGFCMFENGDKINYLDLKKWAKLYWNISRNLNDYIKNKPKGLKYDMSEILIPSAIPAIETAYLGYWDKKGKFHFSKNFKNFVVNEHKQDFKKILELYP